MHKLIYIVLILIIGISGSALSQAKPVIKAVKKTIGSQVTVTGSGFGEPCHSCELVIAYSSSQKYSARIVSWANTKITAHVPDINSTLKVKLTVQRPGVKSKGHHYTIARKITPAREINRPINSTQGKKIKLFNFSHNVSIGDKGTDKVDVSSVSPACGKTSKVFDHARIVYARRRFGEAQITSSPPAGCTQCSPLKVRWFHEPTGRLNYQVHIYQREVEGACAKLKRH